MPSRRERTKARYAEDPDYRQRMLAYNRAWKATHKDEINRRRRERRASDPEYRERSIARRGERDRRGQLKLNYGLSLEDYNAMLAQQNGVCAICERKSDRTLCVDHCHATRMVRRLLCRKCNLGLGHFDDDPRLLRKAAAYLEHFRRAARKGPRRRIRKLPATSSASPPRRRPGLRSRTARSANSRRKATRHRKRHCGNARPRRREANCRVAAC